MSCLESYATLRIFSCCLHPKDVSRILGVEATQTCPMDPDSKYRPRRESHYWAWSTDKQVRAIDGLEHVKAIIDLLQGREDQLQQLRRSGCEIDVCCYWVSSGQGGPFLDVAALSALAHYELEIWWDVYFSDPKEYVDDATGGGLDAGA